MEEFYYLSSIINSKWGTESAIWTEEVDNYKKFLRWIKYDLLQTTHNWNYSEPTYDVPYCTVCKCGNIQRSKQTFIKKTFTNDLQNILVKQDHKWRVEWNHKWRKNRDNYQKRKWRWIVRALRKPNSPKMNQAFNYSTLQIREVRRLTNIWKRLI